MIPPAKNDKFRKENVIMPYTYRRPFFLEEEPLSCKENTMKEIQYVQTTHNNLKRNNAM